MRSARKRKSTWRTYTKQAVKALLVIGVIDANIPYILALVDKDPCIELGHAFITEIVAVILGYMIKAYLETKSERKQELEEFQAGMNQQEDL